jgi:hypothetical protein
MTCDWPILGCDTCCDLDVPPDIMEAAQEAAVDWLWNATNRRFGNCEVTILPCLQSCGYTSAMGYGSYPAWIPYRTSGGWVNVSCGCRRSCSCTTISELILPTVGTVSEVAEDGVILDPSAWRVDNMRRLVRLDGGVWPTCQDFTADPPSWTVTYSPGYPVPSMGQLAASTLACQLARRVCGHKCDLPANTTQVTRQGVSITIDPTTNTGLWLVDNWVEMVNKAPARVYSPDVPAPLVTVTSSSESS